MKENQLHWAGNAGRDAERKEFSGGSFYVVPVAYTEKGKDGRADQTTWLDVICFSEWTRETAKTIKKGDNVVAFGKLSIKDTEGKDGQKYRNVSIVAQQLGVITRFANKTSENHHEGFVGEIPF
jgi:single-stranded DNA-binding protein